MVHLQTTCFSWYKYYCYHGAVFLKYVLLLLGSLKFEFTFYLQTRHYVKKTNVDLLLLL